MRKLMALLGTLALMLAVSGTASAGYWNVAYDMSNTTVFTANAGGTFLDNSTGAWRLEFDSPSAGAGAPYSGARFAYGHTDYTSTQDAGIIVVKVKAHTDFLPASGGDTLSITGTTNIAAFTVTDSLVDGTLHCGGPGTPDCVGAGLPPASFEVPTDSSGAFPIPKLVFGTNAGDGDFTADPKTDYPNGTGAGITVITTYKGTEVNRTYVTGDVPALSGGALAGLAAFLLIGGASTLVLRNRRS